MRVLTVDPGDTTGYVIADITDTLLRLKPHQAKHSALEFFQHLSRIQPNYVLCENFRCRNNSPGNLSMTSAHLIGVAKMYCEEFKVEWKTYEPSQGEGGHYKGIKALQREGVYVGGITYHHAMEAMRGFMQWWTFGPGFKYNKSPQVELIKDIRAP
jgi:hypothetical protein